MEGNTLGKLEFYTKISSKRRKTLIRWMSNKEVDYLCLVFKEQRNQYFKLKNQCDDKEIVSLSSLLLALDFYYTKENLAKRKNKTLNLKTLNEIEKINQLDFNKDRVNAKEQMLFDLYSVINTLHNKGYSYRKISKYLEVKHHKKISHTKIGLFIKKHILNKEL